MHRARPFCYVCAGLFLLALTFHLGQRSAQAQSGTAVEGASIDIVQDNTFPRASACVDRFFRWMGENGVLNVYPIPVPGTERIVATDPGGATVLLENGDWLQFSGTAWVLIGNLAGGPTPARAETFGGLKSRYRGERGGR